MIIYLYKYHLKIIYFFLKLLPINKKKITFLSRQVDSESLDFKEIRIPLEKKGYKTKTLCKRMGKGIKEYIKYNFHIYKQMYHIATSKVCIIDSYIIPISVLKHKKSLYVLQIWHSIGKIKMSGYQTLGHRKSTSVFDFENNKKTAMIMQMHKNYNNIIAGGKSFNEFYCKSFNCDESLILNYGLPRIDVLLRDEAKTKKAINKKYPDTTKKPNVCYLPTFRKYDVPELKDFVNGFDFEKFNLIIRCHPNQKVEFNCDKLMNLDGFSTIDILSVADYVITDYSAVALEAMVLDKKIIYYLFDHDKYMNENGMNLDPMKSLTNKCFTRKEDVFKCLTEKYDRRDLNKFRKQYLPDCMGKSTKLIVNKVLEHLK